MGWQSVLLILIIDHPVYGRLGRHGAGAAPYGCFLRMDGEYQDAKVSRIVAGIYIKSENTIPDT